MVDLGKGFLRSHASYCLLWIPSYCLDGEDWKNLFVISMCHAGTMKIVVSKRENKVAGASFYRLIWTNVKNMLFRLHNFPLQQPIIFIFYVRGFFFLKVRGQCTKWPEKIICLIFPFNYKNLISQHSIV